MKTEAFVIPENIKKYLHSEAQKGIIKIARLDIKQKEYVKTANDIQKVSAFCQAPPPFFKALDNANKIGKKKAVIWNKIRSCNVYKNTLWQISLKKLPVKYLGTETHIDFYAEDIMDAIKDYLIGVGGLNE